MGRAFCFITPDGERSFGISVGCMNELSPSSIKEDLIKNASALLITAYLLRDDKKPLFAATMKALDIAKANDVPIVLTLGTENLVTAKREFLTNLARDYVNVLAMNDDESCAFTGLEDPLLSAEKCLDLVDMALITVGPHGLYLCGHVDQEFARKTKDQLHSKSIAEYNMFEYSRPMLKKNCKTKAIKIYTHINPYMGGPGVIKSTNGAGDAALAALLHDMAANEYHREIVPNSSKHQSTFLSYSSLSQISKYANRVSYEVLRQNSPRLLSGLPEREDSLEESYWAR
jgi:inosine kinase